MPNVYTFSFNTGAPEDNGPFPQSMSAGRTVQFSGDEAWHVVLYQFLHFMMGIYGYDFTDKVFVKTFRDEEPIKITTVIDNAATG